MILILILIVFFNNININGINIMMNIIFNMINIIINILYVGMRF